MSDIKKLIGICPYILPKEIRECRYSAKWTEYTELASTRLNEIISGMEVGCDINRNGIGNVRTNF